MSAEDMTGTSGERAVVDRVVEGVAVVLVGDDGVELQLLAAELPGEAKEGTWLRVDRSGPRLVVLGTDEAGEATQRQQIEGRLDRLRQGKRGDRFGPPGE